MNSGTDITAKYDRGTDVLYVTARRAPAARGWEDERGIVWRYDERNTLIGATILDFHLMWSDKLDHLADELAREFGVPPGKISRLLH